MEAKPFTILEKMLGYTNRLLEYSDRYDMEHFLRNQQLIDACVFNLSQIGELSKLMPEEFKGKHPEIAWGAMYYMRNKIVHDYEGVKIDIVWQTIQNNIPALRKSIMDILQKEFHL